MATIHSRLRDCGVPKRKGSKWKTKTHVSTARNFRTQLRRLLLRLSASTDIGSKRSAPSFFTFSRMTASKQAEPCGDVM
eukprot:2744899-Lingulodinium_polyedra.AAC.1